MGGKWSQKESASNMLEQVTYEIADFPIHSREWVLEGKDRMVLPWHWHSQVEFLYVEKGEITILGIFTLVSKFVFKKLYIAFSFA